MNRLRTITMVLIATLSLFFCGTAWAAETVMGNYEGKWYGDEGLEGDLSAKVADEGKGNYRAIVKVDIGEAEPAKGVMQGKQKGDKVEFKGAVEAGGIPDRVYHSTGQIFEGKFTGRFAGPDEQGTFEMKKVTKKSPTLGAKPPKGAIVLFDGKDLSKWETKKGQANPWKLVEGAMEIVPGAPDITTKDEFGDFKLHLEFRIPLMEEARGQGRGNSGVFLPGNCEELQILDSFGFELSNGSCGAIYDQKPPDVNASLPPGEWQTYDITCLVPRFDEKGTMIRKTILTMYHNGVLIHDRFPAKRQTGRRHGEHFRGILLQNHGNPVRFRNIWLLPLKS